MKRYRVVIYNHKSENPYSLFENDVEIYKNLSFTEILFEMRKILVDLVEEETITSEMAFNISGDIHFFNEFFGY